MDRKFDNTEPFIAHRMSCETDHGLLVVRCENFRSGLTFERAELNGIVAAEGYFDTSNLGSAKLSDYCEAFANSVAYRVKLYNGNVKAILAWYKGL